MHVGVCWGRGGGNSWMHVDVLCGVSGHFFLLSVSVAWKKYIFVIVKYHVLIDTHTFKTNS